MDIAGEYLTAPCARAICRDFVSPVSLAGTTGTPCVATLASLPARHGTLRAPGDLARFDCPLTLSSDALAADPGLGLPRNTGSTTVHYIKPPGPDCSDGQVLHDWCLAGYGLAWRSTWRWRLKLPPGGGAEDHAAPPNGILRCSCSASTWSCACACCGIDYLKSPQMPGFGLRVLLLNAQYPCG